MTLTTLNPPTVTRAPGRHMCRFSCCNIDARRLIYTLRLPQSQHHRAGCLTNTSPGQCSLLCEHSTEVVKSAPAAPAHTLLNMCISDSCGRRQKTNLQPSRTCSKNELDSPKQSQHHPPVLSSRSVGSLLALDTSELRRDAGGTQEPMGGWARLLPAVLALPQAPPRRGSLPCGCPGYVQACHACTTDQETVCQRHTSRETITWGPRTVSCLGGPCAQ